MRAGLLTDLIEILQPIVTINEYGEEDTQWKTIHTTRARVIHTGGSRANVNDEIVYDYVKTLQIRYYSDVDEFQRVVWNGKIYRILDIEPDREQQMKTIKIQQVDD